MFIRVLSGNMDASTKPIDHLNFQFEPETKKKSAVRKIVILMVIVHSRRFWLLSSLKVVRLIRVI